MTPFSATATTRGTSPTSLSDAPRRRLFPRAFSTFPCFSHLSGLGLGVGGRSRHHNSRLALACTELTTLLFFPQTAVKGWRSSKQNKKARRGLVHRVTSSFSCFLIISLLLLAQCVLLSQSWLAGPLLSSIARLRFRRGVVNSQMVSGFLLARFRWRSPNRTAFLNTKPLSGTRANSRQDWGGGGGR